MITSLVRCSRPITLHIGGGGYYLANNRGNISVCPNPDVPDATFDLTELVKRVQEEQSNLRLPALFLLPSNTTTSFTFD